MDFIHRMLFSRRPAIQNHDDSSMHDAQHRGAIPEKSPSSFHGARGADRTERTSMPQMPSEGKRLESSKFVLNPLVEKALSDHKAFALKKLKKILQQNISKIDELPHLNDIGCSLSDVFSLNKQVQGQTKTSFTDVRNSLRMIDRTGGLPTTARDKVFELMSELEVSIDRHDETHSSIEHQRSALQVIENQKNDPAAQLAFGIVSGNPLTNIQDIINKNTTELEVQQQTLKAAREACLDVGLQCLFM
jgi:hypothetical protein